MDTTITIDTLVLLVALLYVQQLHFHTYHHQIKQYDLKIAKYQYENSKYQKGYIYWAKTSSNFHEATEI